MRIRSRRAGFFFPCSSFFLLFSLSFSLSFSPHGGDTTVPSALHLFNKDLLCSKTLIQNTHAHTHTITNTHTHTRRSRLLLVTGREEKKKKVRDVGLETLGALFVNSHSDERRESRLAHRGRNANYGLLCLHVAHAHTPTRWFGATIINLSYMCLWWGGCKKKNKCTHKRGNQSGQELLTCCSTMTGFTCECGTGGVTHFAIKRIFSRQGLSPFHKGKTGQSGSREQLLSCQLGKRGNVAWRVTPFCPVHANPRIRWLLLPSLSPFMPGREAGSRGQRRYALLTGKKPLRRLGRAPQIRQRG